MIKKKEKEKEKEKETERKMIKKKKKKKGKCEYTCCTHNLGRIPSLGVGKEKENLCPFHFHNK